MVYEKLFIIGIDSATFNVIDSLIQRGMLQNLSKLRNDGASGVLKSTFPPVTPPAWTSFMTGHNPGKHGVFDFYAPPSFGYDRPVLNAEFIKSKTIWKILSDLGKYVGVVNMPITSPPQKLNGFIIPGMQYTLDTQAAFCHPPELKDEIERVVGEYKVVYGDLVSLYKDDFSSLLKEWREIHSAREKAVLYLMESQPWDVFTAVFYSVDVMQHHFWKYYDKTHPKHVSSKYADIIPEFYQLIDDSLGRIVDRLDSNTLLLVVSDHGAGPETRAFYVNQWLHRLGLLRYKKKYRYLWKIKWPHLIFKAFRRLGVQPIEWVIPLKYLPVLGPHIDPREGLRVHDLIDWSNTRAYAGNHTEAGIYINLKGREPEGVVEKEEYSKLRDHIREELYKLKNGHSGRRLVDKVHYREEIYWGPYLDWAPDLFVELDDGRCLMQKELYHPHLVGPATKSSGTHRMEGVFMANGKNIVSARDLPDLNIMDIAPTVLYSLGFPVPADMDGRVLTEIFAPEELSDRPVEYSKASGAQAENTEGYYDEEENRKMRNMLRDLGYMG